MVRRAALRESPAWLALLAACSGAGSGGLVRRGTWGSDQALAIVADSNVTVRILASGGCYGSYAEFTGSLTGEGFTLQGTYTQLIGAYPGRVQSPARFTGTASGDRVTGQITLTSSAQAFGPYVLTFGVDHPWPPCLYP